MTIAGCGLSLPAIVLTLIVCFICVIGSNAATYYTNIYKTVPTGGTNYEPYVDVTFYGARPLENVFMMLRTARYMNCTTPPPFSSLQRTLVSSVELGGVARIYTQGLASGVYMICYQRAMNQTYVRNGGVLQLSNVTYPFRPLRIGFSIGGNVSASKSSFSCCGPYDAGEPVTCYIYLADSNGVATGNENDTCRISVCPVTDGGGNIIPLVSGPDFVMTGVYSFTFIANVSGCAGSAGITYGGVALGGRSAYFSVLPATAASNMGSSSCVVNDANHVLCNITQRDQFGNAVKTCNFDTAGNIVCTSIL